MIAVATADEMHQLGEKLPTPTKSAPTNPGPPVTATASISFKDNLESLSAWCNVGIIASRWARLAISGTTPPKRACSSTLDAITLANNVRPRTIPTAVSSQDVSIPKTIGSLMRAPIALLGHQGQHQNNPAAVAKMNALHTNTGKINVPTVLMVGLADPITPAGASQRLVDLYAEQYAAEKAAAIKAYQTTRNFKTPTNKLLMLWNTTPSSYTKFNEAGSPITSTPAAQGTNHCNFTSAQLVLVAKSMVQASNTGSLPSGGSFYTALRKAGNLSIDKGIRAPWLKSYGNN